MSEIHFMAKPLLALALIFAGSLVARADNAHSETGTASYYSDAKQDKRTATGERFDQAGLTAAHPSLPLGAWVRVTNLINGRSVDVRINDRKAADDDRIIDLSKGAAKAVGMIRAGLARVKIERILPHAHPITLHEPPHKPEFH